MLLGGRPILRLTKLEKRSLAMATAADQGANLPAKAEQRRASHGRQHRKHDAADGLRGPEQGAAVGKQRAAVERTGERVAEDYLGDHGRSVGHSQQHQELKDQSLIACIISALGRAPQRLRSGPLR